MKNRSLWVLFAVALLGCSSSSDGAAAPASCDPAKRVGTYLFTYTERSGTCGKIEPELASLNPGTDGGAPPTTAGCVVASEQYSEGRCKLERDTTCTTKDGVVHTVAVTRDTVGDGARISGTISFDITPNSGDRCRGTYDVEAVRQ